MRKRATAMRELAQYAPAAPLFDQALAIQRKIAAQDPKDSRSQFDVYVDLTQASYDYEDAADPAFAATPAERRRNLAMAVPLLKQAESIMVALLKVNPANDDWKVALADARVRLGTAEQELGNAGGSAFAAAGVVALKELAAKHENTVFLLDEYVAALLQAEPVSLRNPQLAVAAAEHEVLQTKRQDPAAVLWLAQAYRSAGRIDQARAAAREGLALLPRAASAGTPLSRTRRLLEVEAK